MFDNIEAEWPMFFVYMIIDGVAKGNNEQVEEYSTLLEPLMKETPIGKSCLSHNDLRVTMNKLRNIVPYWNH